MSKNYPVQFLVLAWNWSSHFSKIIFMSVFQATDADFESAIRSHERTIVKYYTDWCGSCQLMSPFFRQLSTYQQFKGLQFIEVNAELNPKARKMAGVNHLPFFAFFKNGNLMKSLSTRNSGAVLEFIVQFS